jgi:glycosyltransferase involved in cell wall biosynthesis
MAVFRRTSAPLEEPVIRILGRLTPADLENIYAGADILLLPSYHEGFPYVVIEAMRAGLAVVTTPSGAIPNIITDGQNGLLVPPKEPSRLAAAISLLLDDRAVMRKMGDRNRALFLRDFSKPAAEAFYSRMAGNQ